MARNTQNQGRRLTRSSAQSAPVQPHSSSDDEQADPNNPDDQDFHLSDDREDSTVDDEESEIEQGRSGRKGKGPSTSRSKRRRPENDEHQELDMDDLPANSEEPLVGTSKSARKTRHKRPCLTVQPHPPTNEKLEVSNYAAVGRQLGQPRLEEMLADPTRRINNRPPPKILAEAQACQAYYKMDKMSLSLLGHTSLQTLESHL